MNEDNVNIEVLLTNIPENWEKLKDHMEGKILPSLKAGKAITRDERAAVVDTAYALRGDVTALYNLAND